MITKWNRAALCKGLWMGAAMLSFLCLLSSPVTALANAGNEEEDTKAEVFKPEYEDSVVAEDAADGQAFAVEGNGKLLDDAKNDETKEFLTVQTKNNQTFFVVIDRSANANNVYMLSLIDEDDLSEFTRDGDGKKASLMLPEQEEKTQEDNIAEEEEKKEKEAMAEEQKKQGDIIRTGIYISAFALLLTVFCMLYYYLKFYRPKKDEENAGSENLEGLDDFWDESEEVDDFWAEPEETGEADGGFSDDETDNRETEDD